MSGDDLAWSSADPGDERHLDEVYCLTFVKGVDPAEALRRMGALPDTVATRTRADHDALHDFDHGYPDLAPALPLPGWAVVFEPGGHHGSGMVAGLSHGTEAVAVLRHDYATSSFGHAVDGELITGFDPDFPANRYGADPDRLLADMVALGFDPDPDAEPEPGGVLPACLRLVERLTGTLPTYEALTGPALSAYVERFFSVAPARPRERFDADAVRALAAGLGLADTPGLAEVLAAPAPVAVDSPLGRHVRDWLTESRRASWSLNDHGGRGRMTDGRRRRGYGLGHLVEALSAYTRH